MRALNYFLAVCAVLAAPLSITAQGTLVALDEDFAQVTNGTEVEPDSVPLEDANGNIATTYTHQAGWTGSLVYAAGGAVVLTAPSEWQSARLQTPTGDYSGPLTITCRAKAIGASDANLVVSVHKGGVKNNIYVATTSGRLPIGSYNLTAGDDWHICQLTLGNKDADLSGFVRFTAQGSVIIDDIRIEIGDEFLAMPIVLPATAFTADGFTSSWQPMRRATSYKVSLYEKQFTSDEENVIYCSDFNGISTLPEGFELPGFSNANLSIDEGTDQTGAIVLHNGEVLSTVSNLSKIKDVHFSLRVGGKSELTENMLASSSIYVEVLDDAGWKEFGSFPAQYYIEAYNMDMEEAAMWLGGFDDKYYAMRLYGKMLPDGCYLIIDDFTYTTGRPSELVITGTPVETEDTCYTFTGLDPIGRYYYSVQAVMADKMSEANPVYAFGLAAPQALPATDIDERGSYTANWEPSAKAQKYIVNNYGVLSTDNDNDDFTVFEEDFSKIDESITDITDPAEAKAYGDPWEPNKRLENLTKLPGWITLGATVAQGYLGVATSEFFKNYIETPNIDLSNADSFMLTVRAVGTPGDQLIIRVNETNYNISFNTDGRIDDTIEIPQGRKSLRLRFLSNGKMPFAIDDIRISQAVKAGTRIMTLLSSTETDADTRSYTMTGLYDYDFRDYAYNVVATMTENAMTAVSDASDFVYVCLDEVTNITMQKNHMRQSDIWYSLNGLRLQGAHHGLNIVKTAGGLTKKVVRH